MREGNGGAPPVGGTPEPAALEDAIRRIQGIQAARVVPGPNGRISEVHVLAGRERGAKQLVRDVQSVILTNFGIDIDYRTVSVVQLEETMGESPARPPAAPPDVEIVERAVAPRPAVVRIITETAAFTTEVRVGLTLNGNERTGASRGPSTAGLRLVADAMVDALTEMLRASAVEVTSAELLTIGSVQIAVVVLRLATSRGEQTLTGSAVVRKDANDGVARATLDALNRVLAWR